MNERQKEKMEKLGLLDDLYSERIVELVRVKYSLNDELAIQRQRDEKPEKFKEYFDFVEECKVQAYKEIYEEDTEPLERGASTSDYQEQIGRLGV